MGFDFLSDNLLLLAWNLGWLLMINVLGLFLLICHKHYQRWRRQLATVEIDKLLSQLVDPELFHEKNQRFHELLKFYFRTDYLDLLYAWVHERLRLAGASAEVYIDNSARCGLFDGISRNLEDKKPERVCIALEVSGLANLRQYIGQVEKFTWSKIYAPFACHALVRIDFEMGMESLFRAYGHKMVNNAELLTICAEIDPVKLQVWSKEDLRWPLPEVLQMYLICE